MSAAPTLLEAAKLAESALSEASWLMDGTGADAECEAAYEALKSAIAAAESAAPTAETRVRWIVQYLDSGEFWRDDSFCCADGAAKRMALDLESYFLTCGYVNRKVRVVRETSVITREVVS